jgi:hypothetical protein
MMAFYGLPFLNEVASTMMFACEKCVHHSIYPHQMVTFIITCHVLSNVNTPFPTLPHFWQKKKKRVAVTYGVTIIIWHIPAVKIHYRPIISVEKKKAKYLKDTKSITHLWVNQVDSGVLHAKLFS